MTTSRYHRLQEITPDQYELEAPAEIEKGALLLDTQTKTVILQLRVNKLKPNISSIMIRADLFDDVGRVLKGADPLILTYSDVNLIETEVIGEQTPIILDPSVRQVEVSLIEVHLTSGRIWKTQSKNLIQKPEQIAILSLEPGLKAQVDREYEIAPPKNSKKLKFLPIQSKDYWVCACGRPNPNSSVECERCGIDKNWGFAILNIEYLRNKFDAFLEQSRLSELEQKKTRKKTTRRLIAIISFATLLTMLIYYTISSIKYVQGLDLLALKQYNEASTVFESLGDFRNSNELMNEADYQRSAELVENLAYQMALDIYRDLNSYKDSEFYHGKLEYLAGDLLTARTILQQLKDNPDAKKYLEKTNALLKFQGTWVDELTGDYIIVVSGREVTYALYERFLDDPKHFYYKVYLKDDNITSDRITFNNEPFFYTYDVAKNKLTEYLEDIRITFHRTN